MGILIVKTQRNKPLQKAINFHLLTFQVSFCILKFNTCQFLRPLQNGALGNRLSRHGLATALG